MTLFEARLSVCLRRQELAELACLTFGQIDMIERGVMTPTRVEKTRIAKALGMEYTDISWFGPHPSEDYSVLSITPVASSGDGQNREGGLGGRVRASSTNAPTPQIRKVKVNYFVYQYTKR